jgi:hypothetical protein
LRIVRQYTVAVAHSARGQCGTVFASLRCVLGISHVSHICETLSYRVAVAMANADLCVEPSFKELFLFLLLTSLNDRELPRQLTACQPRELDSISVSKHELPQDSSELTAVIVRRCPELTNGLTTPGIVVPPIVLRDGPHFRTSESGISSRLKLAGLQSILTAGKPCDPCTGICEG